MLKVEKADGQTCHTCLGSNDEPTVYKVTHKTYGCTFTQYICGECIKQMWDLSRKVYKTGKEQVSDDWGPGKFDREEDDEDWDADNGEEEDWDA